MVEITAKFIALRICRWGKKMMERVWRSDSPSNAQYKEARAATTDFEPSLNLDITMADNSNMQLEQCREIMKCHKLPTPNLTEEDLWIRLHTGVLVDGNKYFWLDKKACICVELYAKSLTITWGTNPEHWTYVFEKIHNSEDWAEIGEIVSLWWLDVKGEFDTRKLTPMTEYEIFFDIELKASAKGWEYPVTIEQNNAFGLMSKFETKLDHLIGKGPALLSVGRFMLPTVPVDTTASASFRLYEHHEHWKTGLIVRGVIIKAAK